MAATKYTYSLPAIEKQITATTIKIKGDSYIVDDATAQAKALQAQLAKPSNSANVTIKYSKAPTRSASSKSATSVPISRTLTYCLRSKNISAGDFSGFGAIVEQIYNDPRGWRGAGIGFKQVDSGCSYYLWLASADSLPGFSSDCSSLWSCRSGQNVIINRDRWFGATDAWVGGGGDLSGYRHMVVNHETGHFLGFGHLYCAGAGQLAPVMQQQSISLQGCKFNPWPTTVELNQVMR